MSANLARLVALVILAAALALLGTRNTPRR